MDRRKFLKNTCGLCLAIGGAAEIISLLESCSSMPVYKTTMKDKVVTVPIAELSGKDSLIVRPAGNNYDVALIKNKQGSWIALLMMCTHAENPLNFSGTDFHCNLHGSSFSREGQVENGPAELPLQKLSVKENSDSLEIKL